jgi:hypothetical protein
MEAPRAVARHDADKFPNTGGIEQAATPLRPLR